VAVVGIIPARMASSRFPGKVLADRTGKPLIQHVFEAARACRTLERIVIATDDQRVADACVRFSAACVMTSPDHPNGTSRLAEAADALALADDDIVVNVQGDEPEMDTSVIDDAVGALRRSAAPMATAAIRMSPGEDVGNPNIVKVVVRADGTALYFSRSRVPFVRDPKGGIDELPLRHVGLYVYRRPFLRVYPTLASTPLERLESLEQLRVLEHGHAIAVAVTRGAPTPGIDTPEQYEAFVARVKAGRSGNH
jgi:3-deoxy-manno-octulosonate cytidylyltransferase (CMP-KDO synthetase)